MKSLVVRNLTYGYPDGRRALDGVNLEIEEGMRVCLAGKNGSGKTTLFLNIDGLLDGDGFISVKGMERSAESMARIRKSVGFLFSHVEHQFIMTDLLNDIILSVGDEASGAAAKKDIAMQWLERFDLARYADRNPLDLSTGEMKRAALAGVLARRPGLLLLDEPLGGLDRENGEKLAAMLRTLSTTMLIATHRRFMVEEVATHVAVMEEGRITGLYERSKALKRRDVRMLLF
ncbi:MAG: energy-coupling factor ABC transporter ATP-binding protein [Spirochaetes bacterium]|jgi:cobalt/nickel transport system ATP-binding protein|nr:energy-coupling factor ABC transporter ATP-binding protein [Spirochaetota bacterium]